MTSPLQNAIVNIRIAWQQPDSILEFDLCRLFREPTDNWARELISPPVESPDPYPNGTANRTLLTNLEKHPTIRQAMCELGGHSRLPVAVSEIYELTLTENGFTTSIKSEIYERFARAERDADQRQSGSTLEFRSDHERESLEGGLALIEDIYGDRLDPCRLDGMLLLGEPHILSLVDRFLRQSRGQ